MFSSPTDWWNRWESERVLICERGSGALNGSERVSSGRLTHTRTMLKGKTEDGGREVGMKGGVLIAALQS